MRNGGVAAAVARRDDAAGAEAGSAAVGPVTWRSTDSSQAAAAIQEFIDGGVWSQFIWWKKVQGCPLKWSWSVRTLAG